MMRARCWGKTWLILVGAGAVLLAVMSPPGAAEGKPPATQPAITPLPAGQIRVAAGQFPVSADLRENARWIRRQMQEARRLQADVVQFCETALTGYGEKDWSSLEKLDWNLLREETKAILDLARELKLWVILGSTHQLKNHKPYNSLYVITAEGKIIDRYDKRFCTGGDLKHYSPGDHLVTFEINGVKCGLLICYDVRFPELYREYCKLGVRLMFHSFYNARLPQEGSILPIMMPITARANAASNGMFVSLSNSCARHSWPCYMITPDGLVAGQLAYDEPGVMVHLVDVKKEYYDPSRGNRELAMQGILNSGQTVDDEWGKDRTRY